MIVAEICNAMPSLFCRQRPAARVLQLVPALLLRQLRHQVGWLLLLHHGGQKQPNCLLVISAGPFWGIHLDRCPGHRDTASTNHSLDGGIGMARLYGRKRAQKRSPGARLFWIGWLRLAAATSSVHAAS